MPALRGLLHEQGKEGWLELKGPGLKVINITWFKSYPVMEQEQSRAWGRAWRLGSGKSETSPQTLVNEPVTQAAGPIFYLVNQSMQEQFHL